MWKKPIGSYPIEGMGEELLHFPTTDHLSLSCRNELSHCLAKASFNKTAVFTATDLHRCHVQWLKQDSHQVFQYCWEVPCLSVSPWSGSYYVYPFYKDWEICVQGYHGTIMEPLVNGCYGWPITHNRGWSQGPVLMSNGMQTFQELRHLRHRGLSRIQTSSNTPPLAVAKQESYTRQVDFFPGSGSPVENLSRV